MKHRLIPAALCVYACMCQQPLGAQSLSTDAAQLAAARIDAALLRDYVAAQIPPGRTSNLPFPAPPAFADDATFLRRACIDLAGRLPTAHEVRGFLNSDFPHKRERLTDALVKEPGAAELRFRMLAETFRVKDDTPVIDWLRKAAADDLPYDQIIGYLVGGGHMSRRDEGNAYRTGVETAYAVLGESLHCAQCHDHPFGDMTQMQTYQFAACFSSSDVFDSIRLPSRYYYRDGKGGDLVKPRLLRLTRERPPNLKHGADHFMEIAHWITHEGTHRFATVAALRTWSGLFGMPGQYLDRTVGGSDPAPTWNEVHENTDIPATCRACYDGMHPNKVTWIGERFTQGATTNAVNVLADEFRRCGHRIGEFQRILARTAAYWRTGIDSKHGGYLALAPHIRRLPSEVIWDRVGNEKTASLPQVPPLGHPLRMLGRGTREWSDESVTPISHELVRFMMNSRDVENAAAAEPAERTTEELFMSLLGRYPNEREKAIAQQHRNEAPETAVQDIAWALLNTKEFMFRP